MNLSYDQKVDDFCKSQDSWKVQTFTSPISYSHEQLWEEDENWLISHPRLNWRPPEPSLSPSLPRRHCCLLPPWQATTSIQTEEEAMKWWRVGRRLSHQKVSGWISNLNPNRIWVWLWFVIHGKKARNGIKRLWSRALAVAKYREVSGRIGPVNGWHHGSPDTFMKVLFILSRDTWCHLNDLGDVGWVMGMRWSERRRREERVHGRRQDTI